MPTVIPNTRRPRRHEPLTVVCAWCDLLLVDGGPEVSHGLCEGCAEAMARSIERLPRPHVDHL